MTPTAVPDDQDTSSPYPSANERIPAPVATILLVLLVLAATGAIGYFAFSGRAAGRGAGEDTVRYEAPIGAGGNAAPVRRP